MTNSGSVDATSYYGAGNYWADAIGIFGITAGTGDVAVTNTGTASVTATAYYGEAIGILADSFGGGNVYVTNDGSVTATAYWAAYGIEGYSRYGDVAVTTGSDSVTSATSAR